MIGVAGQLYPLYDGGSTLAFYIDTKRERYRTVGTVGGGGTSTTAALSHGTTNRGRAFCSLVVCEIAEVWGKRSKPRGASDERHQIRI